MEKKRLTRLCPPDTLFWVSNQGSRFKHSVFFCDRPPAGKGGSKPELEWISQTAYTRPRAIYRPAMKSKTYTFYVASSEKGRMRKIRVPIYVLHFVVLLAIVGGVTVLAAVGSYTRMMWKVGRYNSLRREQDTLKKQYAQLQTTVKDTNQRLSSLQSLATEVAMTYGFMRFRQSPFGLDEVSAGPAGENAAYQRSIEQYLFLRANPTAVALQTEGLRLMPRPGLGDAAYEPSIWPVAGHIT